MGVGCRDFDPPLPVLLTAVATAMRYLAVLVCRWSALGAWDDMITGQRIFRSAGQAADMTPWFLFDLSRHNAKPFVSVAPLLPRAPWFLRQFMPIAPAAFSNQCRTTRNDAWAKRFNRHLIPNKKAHYVWAVSEQTIS